MHWRIGQPDEYDNAHEDGEATEQDEEDLVRKELRAGVEGDAVGDKAAEHAGHAVLQEISDYCE